MGTLNDVVINKLSGGLGRRNPSLDMVSGLLFDTTAAAKPSGMDLEKAYRLASVEDAEGLGITADFDVDGQSAYYQIEQFFRMNPSGDLFIMGVDGATEDSYAKVVARAMDMQTDADGNIRQMAVIYSKVATTAEVKAAVQKGDDQAKLAYTEYMPFEVLVEGKNFVAATAGDADDLQEYNAENVSVVIAMDPEKAKEQKLFIQGGALYKLGFGESVVAVVGSSTDYKVKTGETTEGADIYKQVSGADIVLEYKDVYMQTAAVGMALGAISRAKVSENIAWVEKFNIAGSGFAKAGFVGGKELKTTGTLESLNAKRYIFAKKHTGFPGVYFNDSHTCTLGTSDFAYVENNRTINKATRLLRTALIPSLNKPVLAEADGTLAPTVTKGFENLCKVALEGMVSGQEVSQFDVFVDPNQNILATSELRIKAEIIPVGTARKIIVDLGFKNPFGIDKA